MIPSRLRLLPVLLLLMTIVAGHRTTPRPRRPDPYEAHSAYKYAWFTRDLHDEGSRPHPMPTDNGEGYVPSLMKRRRFRLNLDQYA